MKSQIMHEDGPIIDQVRAGDIERFGVLVDRYRSALTRLALSRLGRADWAEDAVQETFLCAFKSLHTYDSRFSFRTWLWTILLNQCRRHLKKMHRWSSPESDTGSVPHPLEQQHDREVEPIDALLADERLRRVETFLESLPITQSDALRLRFFGHLKFQEIADAMGCSLSTAKNRVRDGLVALSDQLIHDMDEERIASRKSAPTNSSPRNVRQ